MSDVPRLVVGLGNPGKDYAGTRHNVGFEVLGRLAAAAGLSFQREKKWQAEACRTPEGLLLLKPQTYMNLSGRAVAAAARFYKIPAEKVLVVYDDVALPLGQQRFRMTGGSGGHNGIQSLIIELGSRDFPRLKIGIGGVPGSRLTGHVLGRFREEEREVAEKALASAVDAVQVALSEGVSKAANRYNVRPKVPKPEPDPESQPKIPEDEQEIRRPDCSEHEGEGR
ncbi:MAG: aminoacyl-tRNA hydrolase [Roseibacillus sp.]|nr:aminoacyl-tRNA hydrolase [Roseibacillus sp.]MBP36421.1 aminoacyl-tRNA hydrolase [Roseibacillus sp.]MCP4731129.1 aminoacyl-tRNA hydrolase [Roseibacillus sp.]MDP6208971.1 aminoacyl-tRNA hydrolase [Roseibacillus sp.]MDP7107482.1 aminoacyl-tRNA hydrolase [Roseibacillus sp.]